MGLDASFDEALDGGLAAIGVEIDGRARELLRAFAERLLRWNTRVNLTAITEPAEVAEKHLVDSLALLRTLGPARTLLDVGSGGGLPGVALACARGDLDVTCCDSVAKKVAFVKAVAAELDLPVRARAVRAAGEPEAEGLPRADAVVSRAFAEPARWLPLASRYAVEGGAVFAMLGREADEAALRTLGDANGLALEVVDRFTLPRSGAERAVARFRRR
jgi:16S rRNA (guanine527-N7)-methyltransferase